MPNERTDFLGSMKEQSILYSLRFKMYQIDFLDTRMSLHKGSLLCIREISEAGSANFNQAMSLGGRQFR